MSDIPRDLPDLILDAIVTTLEAFSASQTVPVRYHVDRDRRRPLGNADLPHVHVWLESANPEDRRSAAKTHAAERATINVDCTAKADEGDGSPSDEAAATRLHYLRAQVRHALYMLANADFGFAASTIGVKSWPRWTTFVPRGEDRHEDQVVGGRWALEVEYAWQPTDIDHDPLTAIAVTDDTADMWAAEFALPGGDT